ncbi:hypothetical protein G7Z17_g2073 [Cylindrodendrum hubeiense]|uniref:Peptidase C14 caspase domain-containing protein n=1 Tax=Cylindrodendrum hubeiense TaxID=595255 RepID=A0A9P5LBZ5_9HYPO|nr:hypothetical protein G7Z17_g2073 [Cylindrodendrum hubeiense]
MAPSTVPRRFALLIGVNAYLPGPRKDEKGHRLSIDNLRGCVNDVHAIAEMLRDNFQLNDPRILTSSLSPDDPAKATEPEDRQATYNNIESELASIRRCASSGDYFFLHFSGHGKLLDPVSGSPSDTDQDPCLLPSDFRCEQPALRGWQLNIWLKELEEKGVHVAVLLDSCSSGGAWRIDSKYRTPGDWKSTPTLQIDEDAVKGITLQGRFRDTRLSTSWSMNPERFTVMTACHVNEKAAEGDYKGKMHGDFTAAIIRYFEDNNQTEKPSRYCEIRDQITPWLDGQKPFTFGRDSLLFFQSIEGYSRTPVVGTINTSTHEIVLPIGAIHGINEGAEFTSYNPRTPEVRFPIVHVEDFESRATIPDSAMDVAKKADIRLIPSRWCTGPEKFQVYVGHGFKDSLLKNVTERLEVRLANTIEMTRVEQTNELGLKHLMMNLEGDGTIGIHDTPP